MQQIVSSGVSVKDRKRREDARREGTALHFVGVGGIGMSGIAEVLFNQGYRVTGSDIAASDSTKRLEKLGVKITVGHEPANIGGADVVVISSAVKPNNPEVMEAHRRRIPVIPRAEMLGELMRGKVGVAIAGTHGKTTTTSMMASILTAAELDPTIVIGGRVNALGGSNAKLGLGRFVVAEADESDGSFLQLPAMFGVITNIDNDHLDHYGSLESLDQAFVEFVGKLPFYGLTAVCGEDAGVRRCLEKFKKPIVTYGLSSECDFYASNIRITDKGSEFEVHGREHHSDQHRSLGRLELRVPGQHNVLNALAVTAIALDLDVPFSMIEHGLKMFEGVQRRFEVIWRDDASQQAIVDDYGHHPTEVAATLSAAREHWKGRIISVFQPHRYTRTLHCKTGFLSAFRKSDVVLITDIYAAGEEPIAGVSAEELVREMKEAAAQGQEIRYVGSLDDAAEVVKKLFSPGDLVICMGAGSITKLPKKWVTELQA